MFIHVKRASYIASVWKKANVAMLALPPITAHGWNKDGTLTWTYKIFPKEVEEILFDDKSDTNDCIYGSRENDDEEDA